MDRDQFPMPISGELNPLRPYYVPPSIGVAPTSPSQTPLSASTGMPKPTSSVTSAARDFLPDIDIDIDLKSSTSEAWQHSRGLIDTLVWRYTSVVLAQPFDVAKTILQVTQPPSTSPPQSKRPGLSSTTSHTSNRSRSAAYRDHPQHPPSSDDESDDNDIPDYFTTNEPRPRRRPHRNHSKHSPSSSPTPLPRHRRDPNPPPSSSSSPHLLPLSSPQGVLSTLSSLHSSSGAIGLWRATNTTFVYTVLLRTTDSFLRSLLLALLGLPEIAGPDQAGLAPGLSASGGAGFSGLDLSDSPNPVASLLVVGLAGALTGVLLAPLDLVRTRLIVTPLEHAPRGLVQNLRGLRRRLLVSAGLWGPTLAFHGVPSLFSAASPLVLRRYLGISPEMTPGLWGMAAFVTTLSELFVRLPLETVLRRAQVKEIVRATEEGGGGRGRVPLIVEPAPYLGVWGTVYSILYLEGETAVKGKNGMVRKLRGQGVAGLVRGWRIGFWGLVGVWGAGALSPGDVKTRGQF